MTAPLNGIGGSSPLPASAPGPAPAQPGATAPGFAAQLRRSSSLQFSKHALERVQRRGIPTDGQTMHRLERGVELAAGKGSRDAVVMVDGTAFVVSAANRTVITAVDRAHMRDQVFTNIDSAVIA